MERGKGRGKMARCGDSEVRWMEYEDERRRSKKAVRECGAW